jgi:hypothetical protein
MEVDEGLVSRFKQERHEAHPDCSGDEAAYIAEKERLRAEEQMSRDLKKRGVILFRTLSRSDKPYTEWLCVGRLDSFKDVGIYVRAQITSDAALGVDMRLQGDSDPEVHSDQERSLSFHPGVIENSDGTAIDTKHERWADTVAIVSALEAQLGIDPSEDA